MNRMMDGASFRKRARCRRPDPGNCVEQPASRPVTPGADNRIGLTGIEPEEPAADAASRRKPGRFTGRRDEVSTPAVLGQGGAG